MSNTTTKYAVRGDVSNQFYQLDAYSGDLCYSPSGFEPEDGTLFDTARDAFKARETQKYADLSVVPVTITETQSESVESTDLAVQSPEDRFVILRKEVGRVLYLSDSNFGYVESLSEAHLFASMTALLTALQRRAMTNPTGQFNPFLEGIHRVTPGKTVKTYSVGAAL